MSWIREIVRRMKSLIRDAFSSSNTSKDESDAYCQEPSSDAIQTLSLKCRLPERPLPPHDRVRVRRSRELRGIVATLGRGSRDALAFVHYEYLIRLE